MKLKVGDRIRITGLPGEGVQNYYLHRDTRRVYKLLVARKRPVRISEIDNDGTPWYICRFKKKDGTWEMHFLSVLEDDNNWVLVKPRRRKNGLQA